MFEELKEQIGLTETSARVKFRNGKIVYGVIANFVSNKNVSQKLWFIPNHHLNDYDPMHSQLLSEETVLDIDLYLK